MGKLRVVGGLMLAVMCGAAAGQPIFSTKTVDVYKRGQAATKEGDVSTASVVTLHFRNALLSDVLREFGKQIDASVSIEATNDGFTAEPSLDWVAGQRVTVEVSKVSYWDALRAVVAATPVALDPQGKDGALVLVEHPVGAAAGAIAVQEGLLAMMAAPGARREGSLLIAPMVLSRNYEGKDETRLLIRVAAEPRVHGLSQLAVLRLAEMGKEYVTGGDGSWGDEYAGWAFDLGEPPVGGPKVIQMRGDLRIAAGGAPDVQRVLLTPMFQVPAKVPGEVQVDEQCQVFRAPEFAVPRWTFTSRDREVKDVCEVVNYRHGIPDLEGGKLLPSEHGHSVYTESSTLALHNVTDRPETFVVWTTFPPSMVRYTSEPKPEERLGHGEYRVRVEPGATERLTIAYRVDQAREDAVWKASMHAVSDVPLAAASMWKTVTVDETKLTVKAVVPQDGEYVVRGDFSSAADGPVRYACPGSCQSLDVRDKEGRQILRQAAYGPVEVKDGRAVMEFSLTTAGRGLVPAELRWGAGDTKWVRVTLR